MRVTMMACWLALSLGYANLAHAAPSRIDSMYTSLADTACKTLESSEEGGGSYKGRCPGVAGYQLNLLEGDLRQSLTVDAGGNLTCVRLLSPMLPKSPRLAR